MEQKFITSPSDIEAPKWTTLDNGLVVTAAPLWDKEFSVWAELTYAGALYVAKAFGARLLTATEVDVVRAKASCSIPPVELPTDEMRAGMVEAQVDAYRDAHMATFAWAAIHARLVKDELDAASWDGASLVSNVGKHWIAGAPKGRAYLKGWWVEGTKTKSGMQLTSGHYVQAGIPSGPGPHDDGHHDYATTTMLVKL